MPTKSTATAKQPAKIKLTPDQEKALHLLDEAEASAPTLQPGMHAFVLFEVAKTYEKFDKAKTKDLTRQAFLASISMDDDTGDCAESRVCGIKSTMQEKILDAIVKDSPEEAEELMLRAETPVRTEITGELVRKYIEKKNFSHAEDLLTQVADKRDYPFPFATTLILDFPKDQSAECQRVFTQALANFKQFGTSGMFGAPDFGSLILETANRLPSPLVLEAIDSVLDEAKSNESFKNMHVSMASKSHSVALNSLYEMRLFQLLPVLEQIDSSRAESLLRDNAQMRNDLSANPGGMGFFEPEYNGGKGEVAQSISVSMSGDQNVVQMNTALTELQRRQNAIESEASQYPQQAIADALALPITALGLYQSPRAEVLQEIASRVKKQNPTAAKSALDELMKISDQLTDSQVQNLVKAPQIYLEIGDSEGAKSAIKILAQKADDAYAEDNDADDPNLAFKGDWPSTGLWQLCVKTAVKVSPQLVQDILTGIPDSDIVAFEKVGYAKALLGISSGYSASVSHKNKNSNFTMQSD